MSSKLETRRRGKTRQTIGRSAVVAGLAALGLVLSGASRADQPEFVEVDLTVSRISDEPGSIDPRGARIHEQLKSEFRYQSLKVSKTKSLVLSPNEPGAIALPNGKKVRVRPILVDDQGVLLAVEVEGSVKTDLRVRSGQLVILGVERHKGKRLVVSLEPRF